MASESVEQAYETAVDALVDWSAMPPGRGFNVRGILDDFEAAIRTEVEAEWKAAVVLAWGLLDAGALVPADAMDAVPVAVLTARLRALIEDSPPPKEERGER